MRKPKVSVWYSAKARWMVGIESWLMSSPGERRTIVVATYETRASANEYAKGLRRALGIGRSAR
jgi:hypothetical protein